MEGRFFRIWLLVAMLAAGVTCGGFAQTADAPASGVASFVASAAAAVTAPALLAPEDRPWQLTARNVERRDLLMKMSEVQGFSLLVSRDVRGTVDEIATGTVARALDAALHPAGYDWRIWDNCLYVAERVRLERFFEAVAGLESLKLPSARVFGGIFGVLDIPSIIRVLRKHAGTNIMITDTVSGEMSLRLNGIPWERVLLAAVYMNGLKLVVSDFSIMIVP
ncbi:MAG TPA: hypothetical protein VIV61_16695 [Candidatus Ozemobacteraceae bacterium]